MDVKEVHTRVPKRELVCEEQENLRSCRCIELEERSKKAEARIVELELEIEGKKGEYETLEAKFVKLETEMNALEDLVRTLKARNVKIAAHTSCVKCSEQKQNVGGVIDLTEEVEDDDKMVELRVENKVLETEKKKAESELHVWKEKFKELELCVLQTDSAVLGTKEWQLKHFVRGLKGSNAAKSFNQLHIREKSTGSLNVGVNCTIPGTPYNNTPGKHASPFMRDERLENLESEEKCARAVRRQLSYEEEKNIDKKMSPSTPAGAKPVSPSVINICDSDDESDSGAIKMATPQDYITERVSNTMDHVVSGALDIENEKVSDCSLNKAVYNQKYEDMDAFDDNIPSISTPKRKRAANIVTSDSESDDDNIPICQLKRMHLPHSNAVKESSHVENSRTASPLKRDDDICTVTPSRRRLIKQSEGKHKETKYGKGIPTTDEVEVDETEELRSDSEGDSLGGFIVESSDASLKDEDSTSSQSEDRSDGDVDFNQILSRLRRSKDHEYNWKFEADMLASFGKDLELCMKAVCALYRRQTSEEQASKYTFLDNNRGFSKFDALRGSNLAEFLTAGDPQGDVQKSVQELEEHDPEAVELCRTLATRYSKQLFEIYQNGEDPLFPPCADTSQ